MNYGIMYYKSTDNIGDDIQTYTAVRFLPHIDYHIDREDLNCFVPKEKIFTLPKYFVLSQSLDHHELITGYTKFGGRWN